MVCARRPPEAGFKSLEPSVDTWGGDGRPWYGRRARPRAGGARAGRGQSQQATAEGTFAPSAFNKLVKLRPATAGHSMVYARGRAPKARAGRHSRPRPVTAPRGPAAGGGRSPPTKSTKIVDRLVKKLQTATARHSRHGGGLAPKIVGRWGPASRRHSRPRPRGPAPPATAATAAWAGGNTRRFGALSFR